MGTSCEGLQLLRLGGNAFEGGVPEAWAALRCLRTLSLERNRLAGDVGVWLWPALRGMAALLHLDVGGNAFAGALPTGLAEAAPRLRTLRAGGNRLSGPIPDVLGLLPALAVLELQNNGGLSGPIPPSLCECEALETLCLNGNALTGPLPWGLCFYLPKLRQLFLAGNQLSGEIPDSIGQLGALEALNLGRNRFRGAIPVDALGHCGALRSLCLHPNAFELTERELVGVGERLKARFGNKLSFLLPKASDTDAQLTEGHALLRAAPRSGSPSPNKMLLVLDGGGGGGRAVASPPPPIGLMR